MFHMYVTCDVFQFPIAALKLFRFENALSMFVTSPTSQSGIAPNPLATPYEVHRPSTAAASLSPRQLATAVENVASVSAAAGAAQMPDVKVYPFAHTSHTPDSVSLQVTQLATQSEHEETGPDVTLVQVYFA